KVAEQEMKDTLTRHGLTIEQVREFIAKNPRFGSALHRAPFSAGSTPAELINEVADHINLSAGERFARSLKAGLVGASEWTKGAILGAPTSAQKTLELGREFAEELADITREHGPTLVKKSVEQAKAKVSKLPLGSQIQSLFAKAS